MITPFPVCTQTAFRCFVLLWEMGQLKLSTRIDKRRRETRHQKIQIKIGRGPKVTPIS